MAYVRHDPTNGRAVFHGISTDHTRTRGFAVAPAAGFLYALAEYRPCRAMEKTWLAPVRFVYDRFRMAVEITKIVAGGQTGADRAALRFAIDHGIPHGGWCPNGRRAEDGPIDAEYQLKETPGGGYLQRTEWNVRDSDGTVVFSMTAVLSGDSRSTVELARRYGKPCLHLSAQSAGDEAPRLLREFIEERGVRVLNVAGPRGSKEPDVAMFVTMTLKKVLVPDEKV